MEITYDSEKRSLTIEHRGLDFEDSVRVFAGALLTIEDDRRDYGERRFQSLGLLDGRLVMVVWTPRSEARHVISMRKANERERRRYEAELDRSG
jgi:uncharacterized DUF497 family protein